MDIREILNRINFHDSDLVSLTIDGSGSLDFIVLIDEHWNQEICSRIDGFRLHSVYQIVEYKVPSLAVILSIEAEIASERCSSHDGIGEGEKATLISVSFVDGRLSVMCSGEAELLETELGERPYTRDELRSIGEELPERGAVCSICHELIPKFADLSQGDAESIKQLVDENDLVAAVKKLREATGCSQKWAKIWVGHRGNPTDCIPKPPCPYCGVPLRSAFAKQCPHCLMDWHDPDHTTRLG